MTKIPNQRDIDLMSEGIATLGYFMFNGFANDPQSDGSCFPENKPYSSLAAIMGLLIQGQDDNRRELFMLQHHDSEIPKEMRVCSPITRDMYVRLIRSRLREARNKWPDHSIYRIRLQELVRTDLKILLDANRKVA